MLLLSDEFVLDETPAAAAFAEDPDSEEMFVGTRPGVSVCVTESTALDTFVAVPFGDDDEGSSTLSPGAVVD